MQRSIRMWVLLCVVLTGVTGCTTLLVGRDDSRCAQDLDAVERTAQAARSELARGVGAEIRQATLTRLIDAAGHARATCGYEAPDTPSSERARKPKAG